MLNMAFLFLCSNMAFNSVLVMRDRISILFSMGIVCIMPYLIAVLCHSKAKVFIVGLLFAFMFAQVYVQHNTPAAKYENILLGISDKARAKIRIFEESSKACLLYTSDAADDSLRVDLGGRRIIKKKNFFKQKTAYEISACLVGSEMCIRDSCWTTRPRRRTSAWPLGRPSWPGM